MIVLVFNFYYYCVSSIRFFTIWTSIQIVFYFFFNFDNWCVIVFYFKNLFIKTGLFFSGKILTLGKFPLSVILKETLNNRHVRLSKLESINLIENENLNYPKFNEINPSIVVSSDWQFLKLENYRSFYWRNCENHHFWI